MSWAHKSIIWCFRLIFVLVPLVFLPNTSELFEFNKLIIVYIFTVIIFFLWIIRMVIEGKWLFRKSLLDWPIIIFLAFQFISLLFSIDIRTSWMGYYSRFNGGFLSLVCYSILYWSAVTHLDSKTTKSTIAFCLYTSALVAAYGILEHFGIDKSLWVQDVQTRVFSTLGQPNWLAAYIAALIFIPLATLTNNQTNLRNRKLIIGNWLLVTILFVTLLFTKSRSGLAAFGISSIIFWLLQIKEHGFMQFKSHAFIGFWLIVITFSLIIPTPFRDYVIKPQVKPPVASSSKEGPALESGGTESGTIRRIVWQGALDIWRSSNKTWWLGTGPETFAMAYYQHRPIAHNTTSEWELLYNKAHNEFLNYLATTGVLGLGSYTLLLVIMLITFFKNPHVSNMAGGRQDFKFQISLLVGWLTIPMTNFWGFSVVIIQVLMFILPSFARRHSGCRPANICR